MAAAQRKSLLYQIMTQRLKQRQTPTTATSAATTAVGIELHHRPRSHYNNGEAPESGEDQEGTQMMKKKRRMRKLKKMR